MNKKKNVIVIMTDGARSDFMLNPKLTPTTHKFLKKYGGVKYDNVYTTSTWTLPAQMSLFTGQLPVQHGLDDITYCNRREIIKTIDRNFFSAKNVKQKDFLVDRLNKAGYETKIFSNYITYNFLAENHHKLFNKTIFWDFFYHQHKKIEEEDFNKPFFWFVYGDDGGHAPYGVMKRDCRRHLEQHKKAGNYVNDLMARNNPTKWNENKLKGMVKEQVKQFDTEKLSKFWEWFVRNKLYKDTIVFLISDHGEEYYEHNWVGHVANCYEGIVNIPVIMYHPDIKLLSTDSELHSIVDITSTILDVDDYKEGINLFKSDKSRVVYFEFKRDAELWKRRRAYTPENLKIRGLRWKDWKYIVSYKTNGQKVTELFNIKRDGREQNNLVDRIEYIAFCRNLHKKLRNKFNDI